MLKNMLSLQFRRVPVRSWIWMLLFLSCYMAQLIRINFRYTKYYMVSESTTSRYKPWCLASRTSKSINSEVKVPWRNLTQLNYGKRFPWTQFQIDSITTLFHVGFLSASIFVGFILELIGPYSILLGSVVIAAVLNILRVAMAYAHWKALAIVEFFIGFDLALSVPAMLVWMARWAPPTERGIFVCVFIGTELADVVMGLSMKYITPVLGWQAIYCICSSQVLILCALHWLLGSSTPDCHKFISLEELSYIRDSQGQQISFTKSIPPYQRILKSAAFWVLAFVNFGFACSRMLHFVIMPDYLYEYVGRPYSKTPSMEFLPYVGFKAIALIASASADALRRRDSIKNRRLVKIYLFFSHFIPGCILPFITLAGCDLTSILAIMSVSLSFLGFAYVSSHRTLTEISPNFIGAMYGLIQIPIAATSILVHKIEEKFWGHTRSPHIWSAIFALGSLFTILPTALFWKFGKVECQQWNRKVEDRKVDKLSSTHKPANSDQNIQLVLRRKDKSERTDAESNVSSIVSRNEASTSLSPNSTRLSSNTDTTASDWFRSLW